MPSVFTSVYPKTMSGSRSCTHPLGRRIITPLCDSGLAFAAQKCPAMLILLRSGQLRCPPRSTRMVSSRKVRVCLYSLYETQDHMRVKPQLRDFSYT